MKSIKEEKLIVSAVNSCVEAALFEHDIDVQKYFLKAAKFGKDFLNSTEYDHNEFVKKLKELRILNQLKSSKFGRTMTFSEFKQFKPKLLIRLLLKYNLHHFCMEVAKSMEVKDVTVIYEDWAIKKIKVF